MPENIIVTLAKVRCDIKTSSGRLTVNQFDSDGGIEVVLHGMLRFYSD